MLIQPPHLPRNANVAVVGAGIAGLSFSYFLSKLRPDVKLTIFDAQSKTGGWINSCTVQDREQRNVLVEKGPRTLRGVSDGTVMMIDTLYALNQGDIVQYIESKSEANRKFLLDANNELVQVPNGVLTMLKFLLSPVGRGVTSGMLGEAFRRGPIHPGRDESAFEMITRRFGTAAVANNIFSAIFHGIYADDIRKLSAQRTLRALVEMEKAHGSWTRAMLERMRANKKAKTEGSGEKNVLSEPLLEYQHALARDKRDLENLKTRLSRIPMLGLQNGLESLPNALRDSLRTSPNVRFLMDKHVSQLAVGNAGQLKLATDGEVFPEAFDHVRVTNTPTVLAQMTSKADLKQLLSEVQSNTVILVNFYLRGKDLLKSVHSFGYLVPQSNRNEENLLGVIFDSVIEQNYKKLSTNEPATRSVSNGNPEVYTKLTAMLGGHWLNGLGEHNVPSDSVVKKAVKTVLSNHLHIQKQDLDKGLWQVTVAKECLPQFHVGYDKWLAHIKSKLAESYGPNLSLGGMAFSKGPGVPDVFQDGFQDALALGSHN
ncbi:LAMI_0A06920g1_1 [Lachancea mirantina]|uniref:Protoporphyrinogen oxidase n=1 Tax=Lachancea mirantina TaxID=1230905 RepID=A0A1G4IQX2_9SACH|nr:LAMI_0A06920g1_1 [Lachancea mirantina]